MQGFQRNSTVPFGQDIDPQSEQHAGPLWAQWVSHTYTPQQNMEDKPKTLSQIH